MRRHSLQLIQVIATTAVVLGTLSGCSNDSEPTNLSGQVVKGPVGNADVCVYAIANGAKAATPLVPCVKSDSTGNYSFTTIDGYSGDMIVEASNGTYKNEATGTAASLTSTLRSIVPANGGTAVAVLTPLTTIAYNSSNGLSSSAFATAAGNVAAQAGLGSTNIITSAPAFASNGTTATNVYAAALGAIAQYQVTTGTNLSQALANWATPTNQAAFQSALTAYIAAAQVIASNSPGAFNLTATGSPLNFNVASGSAAPGSTTTSTTATTTSTATTTNTTTTPSTPSGSTPTNNDFSVSGAITSFVPSISFGTGTANNSTVSFTSLDGKSIAIVQTLTPTTVRTGVQMTLTDGRGWSYQCADAACTGKVDVNLTNKTVAFGNITLLPGTNSTGNVVLNGTLTYK